MKTKMSIVIASLVATMTPQLGMGLDYDLNRLQFASKGLTLETSDGKVLRTLTEKGDTDRAANIKRVISTLKDQKGCFVPMTVKLSEMLRKINAEYFLKEFGRQNSFKVEVETFLKREKRDSGFIDSVSARVVIHGKVALTGEDSLLSVVDQERFFRALTRAGIQDQVHLSASRLEVDIQFPEVELAVEGYSEKTSEIVTEDGEKSQTWETTKEPFGVVGADLKCNTSEFDVRDKSPAADQFEKKARALLQKVKKAAQQSQPQEPLDEEEQIQKASEILLDQLGSRDTHSSGERAI